MHGSFGMNLRGFADFESVLNPFFILLYSRANRTYATIDNRQADHHASIIEMEGKLCDQVVSILIDLGSNYSYISPNLVE